MQWYFGFRQTMPRPPGGWVACGPFASYAEAKQERDKAKAGDCQVSTPYSADSLADAQAKCDAGKVF